MKYIPTDHVQITYILFLARMKLLKLRRWNLLISNIEVGTQRHDGHKRNWVFYEVKKFFQQETKEETVIIQL